MEREEENIMKFQRENIREILATLRVVVFQQSQFFLYMYLNYISKNQGYIVSWNNLGGPHNVLLSFNSLITP